MPDQRLAPEIRAPANELLNTINRHLPYVLKIPDLISCRMNTYAAVKATLKTNYLKPFRINTYTKSPTKYLYNEHLQENRGRGAAILPGFGDEPDILDLRNIKRT